LTRHFSQAVKNILSIIATEKCRVNEEILTQVQDEFAQQ